MTEKWKLESRRTVLGLLLNWVVSGCWFRTWTLVKIWILDSSLSSYEIVSKSLVLSKSQFPKLSNRITISTFPGGDSGKEYANAGDTRDAVSILEWGRAPGVENDNPLQYFCLEKFHGQRSLAGYSPWSRKELDTIEPLSAVRSIGLSWRYKEIIPVMLTLC